MLICGSCYILIREETFDFTGPFGTKVSVYTNDILLGSSTLGYHLIKYFPYLNCCCVSLLASFEMIEYYCTKALVALTIDQCMMISLSVLICHISQVCSFGLLVLLLVMHPPPKKKICIHQFGSIVFICNFFRIRKVVAEKTTYIFPCESLKTCIHAMLYYSYVFRRVSFAIYAA